MIAFMNRYKKIAIVLWVIWLILFFVFDGIVGLYRDYIGILEESSYLTFLLTVACTLFFPFLLLVYRYTTKAEMKRMGIVAKLLIAYFVIWIFVSVLKLLLVY